MFLEKNSEMCGSSIFYAFDYEVGQRRIRLIVKKL